MTPLAHTALDFARECLGWEDASSEYASSGVIWNGKHGEDLTGLHFTDLSAVVEAVWWWSGGFRGRVTLQMGPLGFESVVIDFGLRAESPLFDNPCHALLAACVEASRKLGAAG